MQIVASDEARALIAERGGRIYVSVRSQRCCRGVQTLAAASQADARSAWRLVEADCGFALYLPRDLARLPDELHLEARRFPRRIEAYWNGCAWVV